LIKELVLNSDNIKRKNVKLHVIIGLFEYITDLVFLRLF